MADYRRKLADVVNNIYFPSLRKLRWDTEPVRRRAHRPSAVIIVFARSIRVLSLAKRLSQITVIIGDPNGRCQALALARCLRGESKCNARS